MRFGYDLHSLTCLCASLFSKDFRYFLRCVRTSRPHAYSLLDIFKRTTVTAVQVYPEELIRCEYVRPVEGNLKNHRRNFVQSKLSTAPEPGRNAPIAKRYSVTRSSLRLKFDAELSRNADNHISAGKGHHNVCSAMAGMPSNLYAGRVNQSDLQSEPFLTEQAPGTGNHASNQRPIAQLYAKRSNRYA